MEPLWLAFIAFPLIYISIANCAQLRETNMVHKHK